MTLRHYITENIPNLTVRFWTFGQIMVLSVQHLSQEKVMSTTVGQIAIYFSSSSTITTKFNEKSLNLID